MSHQGVSFRIKCLDSRSDIDQKKPGTSNVTQDATVSSITSWNQTQIQSEAVVRKKKLVIPVQPDSYFTLREKLSEDKILEEEAIRAILKETSAEPVTQESVSVPLQLTSFRGSIEESNREEYNDTPVSSFGKAALLGMGWKEGDSVGKTNKGISEPIELIPHSAGLGLGAMARKGHTKKSSKQSGPVVGTDGRVKHHKGLDERVERASEAGRLRPGAYVRICEGSHEGLLGKVRELDADGKHALVSLSLGESYVSLSLSDIVLLDPLTMRPVEDRKSQKSIRKEVKTYGLILRGIQNEPCTDRNSNQEMLPLENGELETTSTTQFKAKQERKTNLLKVNVSPKLSKRPWIRSNLKVRLISKKYKKGRYYNSKVSIVDVVSPGVCLCQSDQGQLLEDVSEEMLETLIPKDISQPVMILNGEYKGQVGYIQQKNPSTCIASVLMEDLDNCFNLSYDDICQVD